MPFRFPARLKVGVNELLGFTNAKPNSNFYTDVLTEDLMPAG